MSRTTLRINNDDKKIIFYLHDFGGNKGFHWGIDVETSIFLNILSKKNEKFPLLSGSTRFRLKSYGFGINELNKLEKWLNKTSLFHRSRISFEDDISGSSFSLNFYKNLGICIKSSEYPYFHSDKYDFDGNYLNKDLDKQQIQISFDDINKKEIVRLKKWITYCKKEILKINKRLERY